MLLGIRSLLLLGVWSLLGICVLLRIWRSLAVRRGLRRCWLLLAVGGPLTVVWPAVRVTLRVL